MLFVVVKRVQRIPSRVAGVVLHADSVSEEGSSISPPPRRH